MRSNSIYWKLFLPCLFSGMIGLASCSSNDEPAQPDNPDPDVVVPDDKEPDGSLQDPEKAKAKITAVGNELTGMIKSTDFQTLADVTKDFDNFTEGLDKWGTPERNDDYYHSASIAGTFLKISKGDIAAFTRAAAPESDVYKAGKYYGIYTYADGKWSKQNSTSELTYKFKTSNNKDAIITAKASGKETVVHYEDNDNNFEASIPEKVEATISVDGKTIASVTVTTSNIKNTSPYALDAVCKASVEDKYVVDAKVSVNASKATSTGEITIGGKKAVVYSCELNGTNMTEQAPDYDDAQNRFNTGKATVSVLDDIIVNGECNDVKSLINKLQDLDDNYDWDDYSDEEYYRKESAIFNTYLTGNLRFKSQTKPSAEVGFQAYMDEQYDYYEYWGTEAFLTFTDGSKVSTNDSFDSETSPFHTLYENVKALIDSFDVIFD